MAQRKAIVIGAGVGGLVAAIDLAVAGHQVIVLETQQAPGGKMRQVIVGGTTLDAGPTVFTMRWVFEEIFANAGVSFTDRLVLRPARVLARHAWGTGGRLDLFADLAESAEAIGRFAGAREAAGFLEFSERARRIYETLEKPFLRAPLPTQLSLVRAAGFAKMLEISPFDTMMRALHTYFTDPRLQQLFGRYATYCGSSPYLAPATLMLVAHVEREGVWLPEGGMHALARALAKLAVEKSAVLRYDSAVARILVKNGRTAGVELASGDAMYAESVVVNADPASLPAGFFGPDVVKAVPAQPAQKRSLSALTWAISGYASGFPLSRHNVFFSPDYPAEFNDILRRKRLPLIPTVYVCAQDRADDETAEAGPRAFSGVGECAFGGRPHGIFGRRNQPMSGNRFSADAPMRPADPPGGNTDHQTGELRKTLSRDGGSALRPGGARPDGDLQTPREPHENPGPLFGRRQHPSGGGGADGSSLGQTGRGERAAGWHFDEDVVPRGYIWWYVDALSDDGQHGITLIAFIGSVFSPWYKWARRNGGGDPYNHVCMNVALYGGKRSWAMTERGAGALSRGADFLQIGPSSVQWDGARLTANLVETTAPIPRRVRGKFQITPAGLATRQIALDGAGRHRWSPIAPGARIDVEFSEPSLRWSGTAYCDTNAGDEPLEEGFKNWSWCRAPLQNGMAVLYHGERRAGGRFCTALRYDRDGTAQDFQAPPDVALKRSLWGINRGTRSETPARVLRTLEDTPFYARSEVALRLLGQDVTAIHETLSLDRFVSPVVQFMLPFKAPRNFASILQGGH